MVGSRTIKTLTALIGAMTIGAFTLIFLEPAPIRPSVQNLAALAGPSDDMANLVSSKEVPLQPANWRNIVVHTTAGERRDIAKGCHFLIDGGTIQPTSLWKGQKAGNHVSASGRDFNTDSIGICLAGDFNKQAPSQEQLSSLITLVQTLQRLCQIPADHVYLNRDLDASSRSPGEAFPQDVFNSSLLRAR